MGLLDLFKRPKTEQAAYYKEYDKQNTNNADHSGSTFSNVKEKIDPFSSDWDDMADAFFTPDEEIPEEFCIYVEDVFSITGRGTVITGHISSGSVSVGDTVTLSRTDGSTRPVTVVGIEMFRKTLDTAGVGDNVGLLIRSITKADIGRGDKLTK